MKKSNSKNNLTGNKKHHGHSSPENFMSVKDTKKQRKEIENQKLAIETDQIDIQNSNTFDESTKLNISEYKDLIESCIYFITFQEDHLKVKKDEIRHFKEKFSDLFSKLPKFSISNIEFGQKELQVKYFLSSFLEIMFKDMENDNEQIKKFYRGFYFVNMEEKNRSFWKDFLNSFEDQTPDKLKLRNFRIDLILTNFSKKDKKLKDKFNALIFSDDFLVMSVDDNIFKCEGINMKEILMKIISNDFVLNCFSRVLGMGTQTTVDEAHMRENLLKIIADLDQICFTKYNSFSILGMTIFSGDIILKREWLDEISNIIEKMRFDEDLIRKLTIYERLGKMNYSFTDETDLTMEYYAYISIIILTVIHEMVHIYRRKYINKNSFDNTPKFKLGNIEFDDGGDGVDYLMFGKLLEKIYPMQAEFILKIEKWKFPLNEKDNFQTQFKNLSKIDKSQPVRFKFLGGIPLGRCLRSLTRSNKNN